MNLCDLTTDLCHVRLEASYILAERRYTLIDSFPGSLAYHVSES